MHILIYNVTKEEEMKIISIKKASNKSKRNNINIISSNNYYFDYISRSRNKYSIR